MAPAIPDRPTRPTNVPDSLRSFDRFAARAAAIAGRAPFFSACVILVAAWIPTALWMNVDTWQLTIQTATAVITFLLVALIQNSQSRSDAATQRRLNELADSLANLSRASNLDDPELRRDQRELKAAVGLEKREPS